VRVCYYYWANLRSLFLDCKNSKVFLFVFFLPLNGFNGSRTSHMGMKWVKRDAFYLTIRRSDQNH